MRGAIFFMEQSNLPSNPAQITKELVKAAFNIELARLDYQKILQSIESIIWTPQNIDQPLLEPAKYVAGKITEKKELLKRPHIDAGKVIQAEYNDLFNPINDAISRKANERKIIADKMLLEADKARAETDRINGISKGIATFISNITNEITTSDNNKMIAAAEMRIGSETQRRNIYQEFLPDLQKQCDELKPLIKKQKEYIKLMNDLNKNQIEAEAKGDDTKAVELRHNAEDLKEVIDENRLRIQQKAYEQVENSTVMVGQPTAIAPKASRTSWKWKVEDVSFLAKKHPEFTEVIPNKIKIDEILDRMKEDGSLDGKREVKWNGITFFEDKTYK